MSVVSSRKPYRVGRSRTGLGLFATRPIAKGTEIIHYLGRMLDARNKDDDAIENKYLFQINGRWTIDGSARSNIARYINHACRPNAESDVNQRSRTVIIRAIKNIAPGEEINYDYGTEYFKAYLKPIGCKCDACERKRARAAESAANGKVPGKAAKRTATKGAAAEGKKARAAKGKAANGKTVEPAKTVSAAAGKAVAKKTAAKKASPKPATGRAAAGRRGPSRKG